MVFVYTGATAQLSKVSVDGASAVGGMGGEVQAVSGSGSGGGGGLGGAGGDASDSASAGGGGGGYAGKGGNGRSDSGGGGGGEFGAGGHGSSSGFGGGGGGGRQGNGAIGVNPQGGGGGSINNASNTTGGSVGGGNGGTLNNSGTAGTDLGGGGGGGYHGAGGAGGVSGGGGGGGGGTNAGGPGGLGGGGGGGRASGAGQNGGGGGFGAGGGGGENAGLGGTYGGDGGAGPNASGGGGAALGGAFFVADGGSLTIDGVSFSGSYSVTAGSTPGGGDTTPATPGQAMGKLMFVYGSGSTTFSVPGGTTLTLADADALAGTGALVKNGAGTLVLNGANPHYSGAFAVNAGTLGGTGSIGGTVTVANGAALAPGNSAGTFTVGHLVLNNTSVLDFELGDPAGTAGTDSDLIQVAGDLTLDGVINVTGLSELGAGTYLILEYGGTLTNNNLTVGPLPTGYGATIDLATIGQVKLVVALNSYEIAVNAGTGGTAGCTPNPASHGSTVTCSATPAAGYSFAGWSGGCADSFSVSSNLSCTASFALDTSYSAPAPAGGGTVISDLSGGGGSCGFASISYRDAADVAPLPPGMSFPYGVVDFTTNTCDAGGTISVTLTYPAPLPVGTVFYKYGPPAAGEPARWYVHPATIAGNTVTYSVTDNDAGDSNLATGVIRDSAGAALPAGAGATAIPTLSQWGMMVLSLLAALVGMGSLRRRGVV